MTTYVIAYLEYSPRHMPVMKHCIGDLQRVINELVGFNTQVLKDNDFSDIYKVLAYLSKTKTNNEYRLIYDH